MIKFSDEMKENISTAFLERSIKAELDKDPERKGYSVLVHIDKIRCYGGDQVLQER
ncbi:MAG: hypothetical protein V3W37_04350 [Candidatus Binatia bacterium]